MQELDFVAEAAAREAIEARLNAPGHSPVEEVAGSAEEDETALAAVVTAEALARRRAALGVTYVHDYLAARLARRVAPRRLGAAGARGAWLYLGPAGLWTALCGGRVGLRREEGRPRIGVDPLLIPRGQEDRELLGIASGAGGSIAFGRSAPSGLQTQAVELLGLEELDLRLTRLDWAIGAEETSWWAEEPDPAGDHDLAGRGAILWGAVCLGVAQAGLEWSLEYSRHRRVAGKPISQHQAVALRLAEAASALESTRLLLSEAARVPRALRGDSARASYTYAAERSYEALAHAFRIPGGHGYLTRNPVEGWLRDLQTLRLLADAAVGSDGDAC
jgi:hypothetical protein